jgi:hypothetical protein
LSDVIAYKIVHTLRSGQRREGFAGVHLAQLRDWFEARRALRNPARDRSLRRRSQSLVH